MGCKPSVITVCIRNDYDQSIHVKIDREKKYVTSREYRVGANLDVSGFGGGAEVEGASEWDWNKIKAEFTRIPKGGFQSFELLVSKLDRQWYVTVVSDAGKVLCESLPRINVRKMIVAPSGNLCKAKKGSSVAYAFLDQAGVPTKEYKGPGQ